MSDNNTKLITLLSRVLAVEISLITDGTSPENTDSWDSFNGLVMVSELEVEFDVHFTIEEVYAVRTVKNIRESLKQHGILFD